MKRNLIPKYAIAAGFMFAVSSWAAGPVDPSTQRPNLAVDWSKEKKEAPKRTSGALTVTENKWVMHVKITNRGSTPQAAMEAHIQTYYSVPQGAGNALEVSHKDCVKPVPPLAPGQTVTVDSDPVSIDTMTTQMGYHFTNGSGRYQAMHIRGVAVTLMAGGTQVHEFVASGITKAPESLSDTKKKK